MRVAVAGVSKNPEIFIERKIKGLRQAGIQVDILSKLKIFTKPDVLHFEWNNAAVETLDHFDFFKCPKVISCRGAFVNIAPHNPKRKKFKQGLIESFQKADGIHCVSNAIAEEVQKLGASSEKIRVIRPAVDIDFFSPKKESKQKKIVRLITVGTLIWRKGYEYLLQSIKELKDKGVNLHLEIIGSGDKNQWQRLRFTIQDLELEAQVHLSGKKTPEEIRSSLQASDIFILASLSEGISNAVLEAMACGVPIVTTDCGGMPEAVRDGVEGFVVPIRDVKAMAQATEKLIQNPSLRISMGKAACSRTKEFFNAKHQIQEFLDWYQEIVKRYAKI